MRFNKIKSAPLIGYICLLPILIGLAIWQWHRAEEKREIMRLQEERQRAAPVKLIADAGKHIEQLFYAPVEISGHYDNQHQFLLDNQVVNGKIGYFVLTPLRLNGLNHAVLVNRGWVPQGEDRRKLPDVTVTEAEISLRGIVNHFPRPGLVLAGAEIPSKSWPATVQVIDIKVLENLLSYALLDFQVELNQVDPHGYKREWQHRQTIPPEKHMAYAGQWLLLALLLTVLFFKYGLNKNE